MSTAVVVATLVLAGCGSQDQADHPTETSVPREKRVEAVYSEECGGLLADAAAVDASEETVEDTDPAIVACGSVDEFTAAAEDHPGALDGADPVTWLENRCQHAQGPDVADSDICQELANEG